MPVKWFQLAKRARERTNERAKANEKSRFMHTIYPHIKHNPSSNAWTYSSFLVDRCRMLRTPARKYDIELKSKKCRSKIVNISKSFFFLFKYAVDSAKEVNELNKQGCAKGVSSYKYAFARSRMERRLLRLFCSRLCYCLFSIAGAQKRFHISHNMIFVLNLYLKDSWGYDTNRYIHPLENQ